MAEYNKCAALADTIKIEDITSNKQNQTILQRLKDNDASLHQLNICVESNGNYNDYVPDIGEDIGWLGYFVGQNTTVHELIFYTIPNNNNVGSLCNCLSHNKTISALVCICDLLDGQIFRMLDSFFKNNHNLKEIQVEECGTGTEGLRQFMSAITGCNQSLKIVTTMARINEIEDEQLELDNMIAAFSMHPQLEELGLGGMNIGRDRCIALSTLLHSTTQLHTLHLSNNNIDDDGLESLVNGLAHLNQLQKLNLSINPSITIRGWKKLSTLLENSYFKLEEFFLCGCSLDDEETQVLVKGIANSHNLQVLHFSTNPSITTRGWKAVSTLLEMPKSNLKKLHVHNNNLGDEGALVFAKALARNNTLEMLGLSGPGSGGITTEGWKPFSELLCDTSTVNNTYMSNHTLQSFGPKSLIPVVVPDSIQSHLTLNILKNKDEAAVWKILQTHRHFDMQPFFEWELKVLPIMIKWFTKAFTLCEASYAIYTNEYKRKIRKMKLSTVYDFIKEFPMLYIESVTRQEIDEYNVVEGELLRGDQMGGKQEVRLEEIRQLKARAMMRLG